MDEQKILEALAILIEAGRLAIFDPEHSTLKMVESVCINGELVQLNAQRD
jgi:hypothetical protein